MSPKHAPNTATNIYPFEAGNPRRQCRVLLLRSLAATAAATPPTRKRKVGQNRPGDGRERPGQDHGIAGGVARRGGANFLNPFPGARWTGGRANELFPHSRAQLAREGFYPGFYGGVLSISEVGNARAGGENYGFEFVAKTEGGGMLAYMIVLL